MDARGESASGRWRPNGASYHHVQLRLRLGDLDFQPHVVLPGSAPARKGPHVFKLHGSSNWRHLSPAYGDSNDTTPAVTEENDAIELAQRKDFTATCDRTELAIAAPGPGKQYQALRFKDLWDTAADALKAAGAVVFLGYRLAPTDARSRRFFLDNLPQGRIPIHVVLGHDTSSPDARRMTGLLKMARPQACIEALPMFGQDYRNPCTNDVAQRGLAAVGENASKMTRRSGRAVYLG